MMSRKREAIYMGIGILAGLALSGPATQAATAALTASPTSQTFYVNDQKVEFEAYAIHGNNFIKLRDVGTPLSGRMGRNTPATSTPTARRNAKNCWLN